MFFCSKEVTEVIDNDNNIVKKLNKVDFHIHSVASTKDGDKVEFNTIDNINVLVNKLIDNGISMAAITDHNAFDIDMYNKFKSFEGNKLNKVLPGIEFDVEFEGQRIHIITIFNDADHSKIEKIPRILAETPFDNKKKNAYTEKTYKDILKQVDTNVLLIAHQKSGIRANCQNENLSKIGENEFDYIIGIDYFDAVEFRSGKVEGILKDYKKEKDLDNLRYITGTDCHDWSVYPQQDKKDKSDIQYSYLKCLPTFKGLVMSLTDSKRVTTAYYELKQPFIDNINLSVNGNQYTIPLSQGLNVIIGDNSIGKSLILECLIDSTFSNIKSISKKNGYKSYMKNLKLKIDSFSKEEVKKIHYDCQGKIRELFQSGTKLLDIPFFKNKFKKLDNTLIENKVMDYVDRVINKININQNTETVNTELDYDISIPSEIEDKTYLLRITDNFNLKTYDYKTICTSLNNIIIALQKINNLEGFKDSKIINNIIDKLVKLKIKYTKKNQEQSYKQAIVSKIRNICSKYEEDNKEKAQSQENLLVEYKQNIVIARDKIINKIKDYNKSDYKIIDSFETIEINKETNPEGKYDFVTQTICDKITKTELIRILTFPFSNLSSIERLETFNKSEFENKLKKSLKNNGDNFEVVYKEAVKDYLNKKILKQETHIYVNDIKIPNGNSQGKNALIYLDVIADEKTNKLYIVDQPDDDISHLKLKSEVINIMRRMSDNKQVLFITHKPELVVNLDVDNVIILKQVEDNIIVNSGALEYESKEKNINILKDVAEILDGGEEIIRKRWKRYDK